MGVSAEIFRVPPSDFHRNNFPRATDTGDGTARIRSCEDVRAARLLNVNLQWGESSKFHWILSIIAV